MMSITIWKENFGAVATFVVLAAVTITERHAPQRRVTHLMTRCSAGTPVTAAGYRKLLAEAGLNALSVDLRSEGGAIEYRAIADRFDEERAQRLVDVLSGDKHVLAFEIRPQQA